MGIDRDIKHLLDAGDTLVGNLVDPIGANGAWNPNQMIIVPAPNPDRILNLSCGSDTGQMVTVAATAFSGNPAGQNIQNVSLAGPLALRVEFGNGAQTHFAEIDIPISGRSAPPQTVGAPPTDLLTQTFINTIEGGTQLTVPGGTLRIYGRNDSNLVTPASSLFNNDSFGLPTSLGGAGRPGEKNIPRGMGPWWAANPVGGPFAASEVMPVPASMRASATYFGRPSGERTRNTKTIWCYNALPGNDAQVLTAGNNPAVYFCPPFAKSLTVYRNKTTAGGTVLGPTASILISLYDQQMNPYEPLELITVAGGAQCPTIDLPISVVAIGIETATDTVTQLCLVFEIGI